MKRISLLFLFVSLIQPLFSQTISGKVLDVQNAPIEGAHIFNTSSGQHTHSDPQGKFVLKDFSEGDTIQFSHLIFEITEVVLKDLEAELIIQLDEKFIDLEEVVIAPRLNALKIISAVDLQVNPVRSSQDILRQVPGLFIGQHAGGGKAEQIFLRGFDVDHGTDVALSVDGLPVNMVSHAHGQGYADLHFVIPETVEKIDFGKGPYYSQIGNFNTAGYVDFQTKNTLKSNTLKIEKGRFNTNRFVGLFKMLDKDQQDIYLASEFLTSDGPFESPQDFSRLNFFGKYAGKLSPNDRMTLSASHFTSKWNASGQIPQRAVDQGLITNFGAIDDTEGGETSRTNVVWNHSKIISDRSFIKNNLYYSRYAFELYSNFTFFLEDPVNGDQIRQKETRDMFGFQSAYHRTVSKGFWQGNWQVGLQWRDDRSKENELSHTLNRKEIIDPSFSLQRSGIGVIGIEVKKQPF